MMDKIQQLENEIASMKAFWGTLRTQLERDVKAITSGGGGAGSIVELDLPVKTVYSDYAVGRRDYYIGVNHQIPVTITLPTSWNGRSIVIKDENGIADFVPIHVYGHIDGSIQTVTIASKYMALAFIYNNGWRAI